MDSSSEWLQKRLVKYRSSENDMYESIEELDDMDKLGQGFTSADPLEEVDIGDGSVTRPTFINKNLKADCKAKLIELLKEYVCCFAWEYHEMPGLSRELVEHRVPIKAGFRPYKQSPESLIRKPMTGSRKRSVDCLKLISFDLAGMPSGFLTLSQWRRKDPAS